MYRYLQLEKHQYSYGVSHHQHISMPRALCKPYLFFRLTLNLMPPALPAWYAMSLLPSCVSLYTLSISPSANKSQQKVSPTLSCALRLLVTSNILFHTPERTVAVGQPAYYHLVANLQFIRQARFAEKHFALRCNRMSPFYRNPPPLQKSVKSSNPKNLAITFSVFLLGLLS